MKENIITTDEIVVRVNYYDDKKGERHYDLEGMHDKFNSALMRIIVNHMEKGVRVNEAYKPLNR